MNTLGLDFPNGILDRGKIKLNGIEVYARSIDIKLGINDICEATMVFNTNLYGEIGNINTHLRLVPWNKRLRNKLLNFWYSERW